MKKNNTDARAVSYKTGLRDGLPIALGYLSVSFTFGISAVGMGISPLAAILISMTCLTSAGQLAGAGIIAAGGGFAEMALAQLVINIRYSLMSLSLSQKLNEKYNLPHRIISAFGITDEIFAVASGKDGEIAPRYMYGLITLPYIFWAAGTAMGALFGEILPENVKSALGIAIYVMFVAIVIPPAKKIRGVMAVALIAAGLSCIIKFVPIFSGISSGISVIICAVIAAALGAILFPRPETPDKGGAK
ncbi:MAG: AzlC family ABC transporter permease [Oscillospiraceae bacterium]|nr:AzlC family ABC transporter permease [Oscillospiraceae bacterium]